MAATSTSNQSEALDDDPVSHRFPIREIVQEVFQSSRLTFEDETAVRHHLIIAKRSESSLSRWKGKIGFGFGALFSIVGAAGSIPKITSALTSGMSVYFKSDRGKSSLSYRGPFPPVGLVSRIAMGMGAIGCVAELGRYVFRKLVIREIRRLMCLLQDTASLSKRISRWVHDNEVIQRGYVLMATQPKETTNDATKVLSARACLRLRRALFLESRFMIFILRAAAVDLLRKIECETSLDSAEDHICLIPLEEFGESLSVPEDDLETLYLVTDGFSLSAMKSLTGLLDLQVSEYAKLLCTFAITQNSYFGEIGFLRRLRQVCQLLLDAFNRIELEYKFETDGPVETNVRRASVKNSFAPPDYWKSLELHLMAGLKSVRSLETEGLTDNELQKVMQQDMLEKLGYHVKCCSMLLDHLRRRSVLGEQSPPETSEVDISPTKSDFELKEVAKADDEMHVEDDIFEAFILGDASADYRGEPVRSELNDYQEHKQQAKIMLEEIKTLLSVRSQDWNEREQRVRERKGLPQADADDGSASALSVEHCQLTSSWPETPHASGDYITSQDVAPIADALSLMPNDVASIAAALSKQWRSVPEQSFGSGDTESESES